MLHTPLYPAPLTPVQIQQVGRRLLTLQVGQAHELRGLFAALTGGPWVEFLAKRQQLRRVALNLTGGFPDAAERVLDAMPSCRC